MSKSKKTIDNSIAAEIAALRNLTVGELQERYQKLFGYETPSRNRNYLFKKLAFRIQELRYGGLRESVRKKAAELAKDGVLRTRPPKDFNPDPIKPQAHPKDYRLPAPGTILYKKHGRKVHEITVLEDDFEYRGKRYKSLSSIAKTITGTAWNGYLWFGLQKRPSRAKKEEIYGKKTMR